MDNIYAVAEEMVSDLEGTCMGCWVSLADQYIEEGRMTVEFWEQNEPAILYIIDTRIFNCDICGWWYSTSELSNSDCGVVCDGCCEEDE
jgi:hypothetical protein